MTAPKDKDKAIAMAVSQIEKQFGKGAIMRLGKEFRAEPVPAISTGSIGLDLALGVGGVPRGRVMELFGPESSGKTTLALHITAETQRAGGTAAFALTDTDDAIIEVTWDGKIIWEWVCSDHFDEMGFSEEAKNTMSRNPCMKPAGTGMGDWMHMNSMSLLGPNRWYDAGDERFHPENIIWDGRQTNIMAITEKKTGKIVWRVGPDYTATPELRELGQVVGQHHAHMIPRGLPGEGNILVFDNGGWAGYGAPNPGSVTGFNNALRDYSRVLEFDPVTLKVIWQYTPAEAGFLQPVDSCRFYSGFISSAQRLPNGNTLITEGSDGRIFEVTEDHEIVWEYVSPFWGKIETSTFKDLPAKINMVYRGYRVPYDWVPQLDTPEEKAIPRLDITKFRVPGASAGKAQRVTKVKGG